jgi:hypothetical protein
MKLLPILLLLAIPAVGQAQFVFTTNSDSSLNIYQYTGTNTVVVIPNTTNGLPVSTIGDGAFMGNMSLTSVTIPDSVTSINYSAFDSCYNLSSVTLGTNVTSLGDSSFALCFNLASITIPASVTSIADYAFASCGLTNLLFEGNVPAGAGDMFHGDGSEIVYYMLGATGWGSSFYGAPASLWDPEDPSFLCTSTNGAITITGYIGSGGNVTVPDMLLGMPVTGIGDSAFANNASLDGVTVPDSVTSFGVSVFDTCTNLDSVTLGNGLTNINDYDFHVCASLTNVVVPGSVTSIGVSAFDTCTNLMSITIAGSVVSIGDYAFQNCAGLSSIALPDSVTNIGSGGFQNCSDLTNVMIGVYLAGLGSDPFYSCASLLTINVAALNGSFCSVAGILYDRDTNTVIRCPEANTNNCIIPDSVTNIGSDAFEGCVGLTNVVIPTNVVIIGDGAFGGCIGLTNLQIPDSVVIIGDGAFGGSGLVTLTIPNSVTSIGAGAFDGSANLTSIIMGTGVTNITTYPFWDCDSLGGIYFLGNAPNVEYEVLPGGSGTAYYLPNTSGWDSFGFYALSWLPQVQNADGSFGVRTNQFGFDIVWASGQTVVVEACTNLANPVWQPIQTNTLTSDTSYFSDQQSTNYPGRFYRLSSK